MAVFSLPEYGWISPSDDAAREAEDSVFLRKRDFAFLQKWLDNWDPPQTRDNHSDSPDSDEKKAPFTHGRWKRQEALKAQNFVGVIRLPSGDCLEILPKISKKLEEEGKKRSRKILLRILRVVYGTDYKEFKEAALSTGHMPLLEIFIRCFLNEVTTLIRRGIRSDYTPIEENIPCLRGRLLLPQHIRYNVIHRERFYVRYDEYLLDRPENRLVKTALLHVNAIICDNENLRRCKLCLNAFDDIPASANFRADVAHLRQDRNISHYRASLFWSRILLEGNSPVPVPGELRCPALLWPMEKLFEHYVAKMIWRKLSPQGWLVEKQASSEHLVEEPRKYLLKPDLLLKKGKHHVIADTKWKIVGGGNDVNQADLYQLFAYSEKYLRKAGCDPQQSFLIYPKTDAFPSALSAFHFYADTAILKAASFNLEDDTCALFDELVVQRIDKSTFSLFVKTAKRVHKPHLRNTAAGNFSQ